MPDNYNILIKKLDEFIRKYYRNKLLKGTILFFTISLSAFLLITILEFFGHFTPTIRTILFYLFIISVGSIFFIFILDPILKIRKIGKVISHEQAAQIIGKHFSNVQDKLLNTLQLKSMVEANDKDTDLIKAGIEQKIQKLKPIPFVSAVDFSKNKKFLKFAVPPFLIILLLLFIAPSFVTQPSERLLFHNRIYVKDAPFRYLILTSKLEAFQQEDFELKVKVTGEKIPDEIFIESNGNTYKMSKEKKLFFSYTFKSLQRSTLFRLVSGDVKSLDYEIRVYPKPTILNFQVELTYPEYISRKNEILENTGDLILPDGTMVKWSFFTKDAEKIYLNFGNQIKQIKRQEGNRFIYQDQVFQTGNYYIKAENSFISLPDSLKYSITVIPDTYPSINAQQTNDSIYTSRLFFTGVIKDDYGFSQFSFHYTIIQGADTSQKETKKTILPINKVLNQQQYYYSFELSEFLNNPGDELQYYFEICDNDAIHGPKCSRTAMFSFKMPTIEELENQTTEQEQMITKEIQQNLKEAKKLQKQIEDLSKKLVDKNTLSWDEKKQMKDLLDKQKQIKENLEKIKRENEQKNSLEEQFNEYNPDLVEKQKQLNELFDQIMDDETKKMIDEIKKLLEQVDKNQVTQMLEKMKLNNKEIEKQLDRSLELFKQIEFEKNLSELIDNLNKLSEKQDQLAEQSLNKDKSIEELMKEQKEISDEFQNTQKKLQELEKKNNELESPNNLPNLEKEKQEIIEKMDEAMKGLNEKQRSNSSKSQKQASSQMKSMAKKMQDTKDEMEEEELAEDSEKLRQILENLIRISFEQEEIIDQTKLINRNDPRYLKLIQSQNDLKDDLKVVEDSLTQLAKRQVMIKPFIMRELSAINRNINEGVKMLNERNISAAATKQQYVMTSVNNLALMLAETEKQMQMQMQSTCKKKGKSSCNKPGGSGQSSMKSMRKLQEQLNKELKNMKEGLNSGKIDSKGKPVPGQKGVSEKLARLAAQQEALRKEMKNYMDQLTEQGIKDGGGMNEAIKQMEQTEKDLVNKRIAQETINRQEQILTRMLESEKAEMKREQEEKRKSTETKFQKYSNPSAKIEYNRLKPQSVEMLRSAQPSYNYFYKNKINGYFLKFEK